MGTGLFRPLDQEALPAEENEDEALDLDASLFEYLLEEEIDQDNH